MDYYANSFVLNEFTAECLGTGVLVLFGLSGVACNVLSPSTHSIHLPALSFGIGALVAIYLAAPITGAHINPAVTFGFCLIGKCSWRQAPIYMAGQLCGALAATMIVYLLYLPSLRDDQAILASIFLPAPSSTANLATAFLNELVATFLLLLAIQSITDEAFFRSSIPGQALTIGTVLAGVVGAFSFNTGAILNPARDLAPRIFLSLIGYYNLTFRALNGQFWWIVGVLGPISGASLGCYTYRWLAARRTDHLEEERPSKIIPK